MEAMAEIAEAVTQCKFEATDRESDEVELYKILQVSPTGPCSRVQYPLYGR